MSAAAVVKELKQRASPARARASRWFFKTGKGDYGEGDAFFGVAVPEQRRIAKRHAELALQDIAQLLKHKVHECRLTALFILTQQYRAADEKQRERIARFYLSHRRRVNNWDLVDSSAPYILGQHLLDKDRSILYALAKSRSVWERRMAIIATGAFVRAGEYDDTLRLATLAFADRHDLIHKAAGWMLREIGNRSRPTLERFLDQHAAVMPRTMLRYAIEKFPADRRKVYLAMRQAQAAGC